MSNLIVGVSPHMRSKNSTQRIMLDVIIALCPALIASVVIYGFRSLLLTVISAAACVACEFLWEKALKWDITILDGSAVVTGILIAFNVPVQMPIWQLIAGDIFAIIVVKMLFGGIGCNFMNPALGGRILMMFSFTSSITGYTYPANGIDALSSATPLAAQSSLGWNNFMTLFVF